MLAMLAACAAVWVACWWIQRGGKPGDDNRRELFKLYAEVFGGTLVGVFGILEFSSVTAAESATVTLREVGGQPVSLCVEENGGTRYLRLTAKTRVENSGNVEISRISIYAMLEWAGGEGKHAVPVRLPGFGGEDLGESEAAIPLGALQPDSFKEAMLDWRMPLDHETFFQRHGASLRTNPAIIRSCVSPEGDGCFDGRKGLAETAIRLDPHWVDDIRSCALSSAHAELGACWIGAKLVENATLEGCAQHLSYQCSSDASARAMWQSAEVGGPALSAGCPPVDVWLPV